MRKNILGMVFLISIFIMLVAGCTTNPNSDIKSDDTTTKSEAKEHSEDTTVEGEMKKITQRALDTSLTQDDFSEMKKMFEDDEAVLHELGIVESMAKNGHYTHVLHALGFLQTVIDTGVPSICPAHDLGHYYVFIESGESEIANGLLMRVKDTFDAWMDQAEAYQSENPGTLPNYDKAKKMVSERLAKIDSGDTSSTKEIVEFLTNEGAICFDQEGDMDESHSEGHDTDDEHDADEDHDMAESENDAMDDGPDHDK